MIVLVRISFCFVARGLDRDLKKRSFCQALVTKLEKIRCTYFNLALKLSADAGHSFITFHIAWTIFLVTWGVMTLFHVFRSMVSHRMVADLNLELSTWQLLHTLYSDRIESEGQEDMMMETLVRLTLQGL